MAGDSEDSFNESRAEVFEALGHPTRIKILQSLEEKPLGFSELKRAAGVDSNGLLTFHLRKLGDLVTVSAEGSYTLADEGREALRIVQASRNESGGTKPSLPIRIPHSKAIIASLLVILMVLSSVVIYQQVNSTSRLLSSEQAGSVLINGERYWYVSIPYESLRLPVALEFNNVIFNLTALSFGGIGHFTFTVQNMTASTQPSEGAPVTACCLVPLWSVQVRFADGQSETQFSANITKNQGGAIYVDFQPMTNPWFTHHSNPRAGVYYNWATDSLELYVSAAA